MRIFQNYHRHSMYTNIRISDSTARNEDYAKRAQELGHGIISSVEHGFQGRYIEGYEYGKRYGLKFLFGTEAYWVKDRLEKDRTNAHIVLLAKNENGRQAINDILAEANITGYYYQPRLDLSLILSLPKDDVWVTTACIAFWKYNDDQIVIDLHKHFGRNFFLEVQYHNTESQKQLNKKIIDLANRYNIQTIMGCDSHYITEDKAWERDEYIKSSGIVYEDEQGWYLDYPDGDTAYNRFVEQGVLTKAQIETAISNTNILLTVEEYDNPCFTKDIKMPSLYPNLSQEEKDKLFSELIWAKWEEEKKKVPVEKHEYYVSEIQKELDTIIITKHADYFLLDYELVRKAKEKGGVITPSGRGCFTKDALVHTETTMKNISDIKIGDLVICADGKFHPVIDVHKYDIEEKMVKIKHLHGTDTYFPTICTEDHKILINRKNNISYIEARDIQKGDFVCVPKITFEDNSANVIDLNAFNSFGFSYDEEYIYEEYETTGKPYPYSPSDVARNVGLSKATVEKFANGLRVSGTKWENSVRKIMPYIPFNTQEQYCEYVRSIKTRKIKRYLANDELTNTVIGMLYGDGVAKAKKMVVSIALNTKSNKNIENRKLFCDFAERLHVSIYENESKTKNLTQLTINSKILSNFISQMFFESEKGKDKIFNPVLFQQNAKNLSALLDGLFITDGSNSEEYGRKSFDNTSLSLINAFKLLRLATGKAPCSLSYRKGRIDDRGFNNKESYKLRFNDRKDIKERFAVREDENYFYLPVTSIGKLEKRKETVYDLTVEEQHNFLINNMIVHNSGVSNYVNKLLGFTKIDRISASVKMYPERFMSATRILESKSLADLDLNLANPEVFFQTQKELLGEESAYQMLAYGTMKIKSAWKMYARAKGIDAETANVVSEQIEKYEMKLKHAEEEEKEEIDLMDFVESQYHEYLNDSLQYWGIIAQVSPHPCFKAGTLIKTKDGLKNIEEIEAGELVFTHNKRYQKVIATMKSKSEEILKIKANNIFTMATENHPFYVRSISAGYYQKEDGTKAWRRNYSSPYWEQAKNITKNHVIGFPINQESSMLTEEGLPTSEYNFWWFIGRYIGDGWTFCRKENGDYRVILSVGKIKTDLADVKEKIFGMFKFRVSEERTAYKIYINSKKLYDFVEKFGKYAYGKHLPSGIIDLPENLLKGFLDGYLSADGHVVTRKNGSVRYSYTTTSKKLAFDIQACVHKIYKMPCYLAYVKSRIGTIEGRTVNCREKWVGTFKKDLTIKDMSFYEDGFIWHKFRSAEKIEHNDFVYNLEVEEDHSYVADGMAVHNCASVVYSGNIRKEIGLVLVKSTSGKKETLCAIMDGKWAEDYKFLKNDLLKVSVVEVIDKSFRRIGMEIPDENELIEMCKNNQNVWDVYGHGFTLGINQVEQNSTRHRVMKYKPKNISELSAFVAAVRPGFKSMYSIFEDRKRFDYGIPVFDNLIQTKEMPNSFLLYQEMSMAALNFAGIQMSECYEVVKNISKKRVEKVTKYKEQFLEGFSKKIVEVEHRTNQEAHDIADKVWQIIEDSTRYQFNASHSYSVAMDSLYGAWLKSQHPLAFYEVFLTVLDEKGSKDRMRAVRAEAENAYKIRFAPLRFRQDNRKITSDENTNSIWGTLKSIKGFGTAIADQMYSMKDMQFDSFVDFLVYLEENGMMSSKIGLLIKVQYFEEFGGGQKLFKIYEEFNGGKNRYNKSHKEETKQKRLVELRNLESELPNEAFPLIKQMSMEQEILGYTQVVMDIDKRYVYVQEINTTYAPRLEVYCLANAKTESMKIDKRTFGSNPVEQYDILYLKKWKSKPQTKYVNGKFEPACGNVFHKSTCKGCPDVDGCSMREWWIEDYEIRNGIKDNA